MQFLDCRTREKFSGLFIWHLLFLSTIYKSQNKGIFSKININWFLLMDTFHFANLVYIIYGLLPFAALSLLKKNWIEQKLNVEVIFILLLLNSFVALDPSNNIVLRIAISISGCIVFILGFRYWYLAKTLFQKKEIIIVASILGAITLQIIGILHPYLFAIIYCLLPILYGKQIWDARCKIAEALPLMAIIGQGAISTLATFDPKNTGFYSYTSAVVVIEMMFALYLYRKQKWANIIRIQEVQIWYLGFFFMSGYIKEQNLKL